MKTGSGDMGTWVSSACLFLAVYLWAGLLLNIKVGIMISFRHYRTKLFCYCLLLSDTSVRKL